MAARTRYSESRILVRNMRRLPGEDRKDFKDKILSLLRAFERFNLDASEICQWLMSLRPGRKLGNESTQPFYEFFLDPARFTAIDEDSDRHRRTAFDFIAGLEDEATLTALPVLQTISDSVRSVSSLPRTETTTRLLERLRTLDAGHRQVLLKSSAEWVFSRYQKGAENHANRRKIWEKEKDEWESAHPALTGNIRNEFTDIFRALGIREKRPKICEWERLKESRNNCTYAGERVGKVRHSSLCLKFRKFQREYFTGGKGQYKKDFERHCAEYLKIRNDNRYGSSKLALDEFERRDRSLRWFRQAWMQYLTALQINEQTALGGLQHCVVFGNECSFNIHTHDCERYYDMLSKKTELWKHEARYREWRREFLSGPSKPSFKYPSSKELPMPKIFGAGFFQADFDKSVLKLRLEGMRDGEFLDFGFAPWPKEYSPQPEQMVITSVHINFMGTRARAGFRFGVSHKASRFGMSQDDIDDIRRKYPRQSQDHDFLREARDMLLGSFEGNRETLRLMAVDLGTSGASAGIFGGRKHEKTAPLKIVKIGKLYSEKPKKDDDANKNNYKFPKEKGLTEHHAGVHLEKWAEEASEMAKKRNSMAFPAALGRHDLRGLSLHMSGMYKDWVRLNAKQIIKTAEENNIDLIVFESMRGFGIPGRDKIADKDEKRRKAFWSQGRIRHKVKEKAVERGMRVVGVPYFRSSQFCSACGKKQGDTKKLKDRKKKKQFKCENESCSKEFNSDENAARVLAKVFWDDIKLPTGKLTDTSD